MPTRSGMSPRHLGCSCQQGEQGGQCLSVASGQLDGGSRGRTSTPPLPVSVGADGHYPRFGARRVGLAPRRHHDRAHQTTTDRGWWGDMIAATREQPGLGVAHQLELGRHDCCGRGVLRGREIGYAAILARGQFRGVINMGYFSRWRGRE